MEQRLNKIVCSVYKLVIYKTHPETLNELISLRETTYALRGKDILKVPKVNTTRFGLMRGTQRLFSVKYLFGEANATQNFLLLEDSLKFLDDCSIHEQFSKLI